jgi:hypothetical protein
VREIAAVTAGTILWMGVAHGMASRSAGGEDQFAHFESAVAGYMTLRKSVERTLPPREMSPDPDEIFLAVDALAAAIRAARRSAKEGDIFDAEAAPLFRRRLRTTLREPDCQPADILAAQGDDDRRTALSRPIVHDQFDWGAGSFMAFCILAVLPELPEELQFRFVERDLVLVDIDADLIIDVLPDALPATESWPGVVHARLPIAEESAPTS